MADATLVLQAPRRAQPGAPGSAAPRGDGDRQPGGALHVQLATIAARLRERALEDGTFSAELASDLEALAVITATLQGIHARVEKFAADLDRSVGQLG